MVRVIVESPYAGDVERNKLYLYAAMRDCLARGESPFASHAIYTQFLDDTKDDERALGIAAGFAWHQGAHKAVVYADHGFSNGMIAGIKNAHENGLRVEIRYLNGGD